MDLVRSKNSAINIYGEQLETVKHLAYLGARINAQTKKKIGHSKHQTNTYEATMEQPRPKAENQNSVPLAMYGCETWSMAKTEKNKIIAFEMKCMGKMLKGPCTAKESIDKIRHRECSPTENKYQKLSYFGVTTL